MKNQIKSIAIFCGSKSGITDVYTQATIQLIKEIAKHKIDIVFGGANVGLMRTVADTALDNNCKVVGVLPKCIAEHRFAHPNLTELHIVNSMSQRKELIGQLSDAFIALPGGLGTMDEFFEMWTFTQLGLHHKAVALLNTQDFYQHLAAQMQHTCSEGFLAKDLANLLIVESSPSKLIEKLFNLDLQFGDKLTELSKTVDNNDE